MKLYAYSAPDIPKHAGYLKIGETHRSTERRISQQGGQVNVEKVSVWHDAIATERTGIDRLFRHFLRDKYGFHIQPNFSGHGESEWVQCTVDDIREAFPKFKELFFHEQKERQIVSDSFYEEIRNWFYWTTQENEKIDADYALRLIIRLLFCFFLREKNELVPKELLDASIEKCLKNDEEYSYYNGVLRNLFFHCLNTSDERKYENEKLLADKKRIKSWFSTIPFLNGGLFDEHNKDDVPIGNDYFFSGKRNRHLSELGKACDVYGIITILSRYQYKLTLDDFLDQAEFGETVDPEFIGKVFESLLACIAAESKETRRKITGSYYTPREIVDYMVNASLDAYLETKRQKGIEGSDTELLLQCKILDPACGSGAFPCEAMNIILHRIEEEKKNNDDHGFSPLERYRTKLKIVQDVMYGVDIQPMAVQITSLRFFLLLIQDIVPDKRKPNYGIQPLPNLEIKFVCADTLIPLVTDRRDAEGRYQKMLEDSIIRNTIKLLRDNRNQYFMASMIQRKSEIRQTDETLRATLSIAMESNGLITHDATKKLATWNPYVQSYAASFFDSVWMFGIEKFDIVIGNPPYGESRSASVSAELKTMYQSQVHSDFGDLSQYITKGSDLFIYFFPRSITLLSEQGIGMLIVQNGWLNTDYGAKASQFLLKTLQHLKIIDSPFRHFDRASANVNTVIIQFRKQSETKNIDFDTMRKEGQKIVTCKGKSFELQDSILSDMKWGMILATDNDMFSILKKVVEKGKTLDQSFYTIGQGINVSKNSFIPKHNKKKFEQKANIINAVFKEYQYTYTRFSYFLYHSFVPNETDTSFLKTINAAEFDNGQRQYPSVIMPRGIGAVHFAGLLNGKALSNSFVDIYMDTQDEERKLNIWLFCNSSLFFLYRELSGRKNLGGGLLKSEAADIKQFPLYFPIADRETILSVANEMGKPVNLLDRLETSDQKKIDELVFSYFEIEPELQSKILNELLRVFRLRLDKAKNSTD